MPSINKIRYEGIDYDILGEELASVESMWIVTEASGSIASCSDGANDVAVKSLVAEITPVQSGSGDPSPSNIRPISGRTGLTVTAAGKNLCGELLQGYWAFADGVAGESDTWVKTPKIRCKAGSTYTASSSYISHWIGFVYYDAYGGYLAKDNTGGERTTYTSTAPATAAYMAVNINSSGTGVQIHPEDITDFQLEESAAKTAYTPYVGQTYPITWQTEAGTIYGGTLDVVSGVLTVDRKYMAVKWSDFTNKTSLGDYTRGLYYFNDTADTPVYPPTASAPQVSNIAPYKAAYAENSLHFYASALCVNMYLPNGTSDNTDIAVCYQLATPAAVYNLTPTEIKTLLGGNTIYTDAGSVSVEYVADTKLYIDNKVAELQALILEN